MSTDWYLCSPQHKKAVMVGSDGLGGAKAWPTEYGGKEFLAWAIEHNVKDVILLDENQLDVLEIEPS